MSSGVTVVAALVESFGIKKIKIGEYAQHMLKNA